MISAAGILFVAGSDNRVLLLRRCADGTGLWSIPGGHIEAGETAEQAARREAFEEIGPYDDSGDLVLWTRRIKDGVDFTTFALRVPEPFEPLLNEEHDSFEWVPLATLVPKSEPGLM